MKRFKVTMTFKRELTRIVKAKTERQAVEIMKKEVHHKIFLRAKDAVKRSERIDPEPDYKQ